MAENEIDNHENDMPTSIRPLIISDRETVNQYCPLLRHMLFGFEAQDVPCAMVVPPKSDIEFLLFPGAKIIEYPILRFPLFYSHNRKDLFERIEEVRPGVVHCFGTAKAMLAKSVAEYLGIPAIITINTTNISFRHRVVIGKAFEKITVPSPKIGESLAKYFPSEKIINVNVGTFADEACSCFASPNRLPSFIVPCRLDNFDHFEPLLNAIRHLAVDGYEFVVIFMGRGRAEKQMRDFINQTGLTQTVAVTPLIRPLRSVFRGCDILIHTNYSGGFDPVVVEAAGAGLAVAADKNNVQELLEENTTAVLFDSTDELSIYGAIQKMLEDKQMTRTLALNLQNNLRSNNSVSAMVSKLLKIYSETKKYSLSLPLL
jgi:glycosyltransferase involved in cell wall biosynthesis